MNAIIDWASGRARMTILFVIMSVIFGIVSYFSLPKEGEPDIEIPALFVSVPAPGISAEDSERLIVKPLETRLSGLTGLDKMASTASEGYGGIALEFDYGWDRNALLAEVRDEMSQAESILPDIVDSYSINEINFSEFPIAVISVSGDVPERTLVSAAKTLRDDILGLSHVLDAQLTGARDEMVEVTVDTQSLETYNLTAEELINAVTNNNQLVAAGEISAGAGRFAVKIPSSFNSPRDVFELPVKVNGDSVITLGDVANIRLTFEDSEGVSRYNGEKTLAIQVVKRKGENIIDTIAAVSAQMEKTRASWDKNLQATVQTELTNDQSKDVQGMVSQLEASVITAILLVMIAVLSALGLRSALLVGFAIPTSFLLTFALMATLGITISNIVMFGLILAVGMLVDSAIVIVEYADQEVSRGKGPMTAYVDSAKRMAWPVIASTATTLCAFLPLLLWPGVAGQFMSNLPKTIIFVLCASLIVALIFLPVMGGVAGRISGKFTEWSDRLREKYSPPVTFAMAIIGIIIAFFALQIAFRGGAILGSIVLILALCCISIFMAASFEKAPPIEIDRPYKRTKFGAFLYKIVSTPWGVATSFGATFVMLGSILFLFINFNNGVEFFAPSEPERANVYVQARGNLSIEEKDRLVHKVEEAITNVKGVKTIFAFSGSGGLNQNTGGGEAPTDTIGIVQIELDDWQDRYAWSGDTGRGVNVLNSITEATSNLAGIKVTTLDLARGPAAAKPINIRLKGDDFDALNEAVKATTAYLEAIGGVTAIEDSTPLPGIDYRLDIDVTEAGRYGANVATVGTMVRLATNGITLGQMRAEGVDDEIDIKVRLPKEDRLISTIQTLRVRTPSGMVPIANFTTQSTQPALSQINRIDQERYYQLSASVEEGINANERLAKLIEWAESGNLPLGVSYELAGDFADQAESTDFLGKAFLGSLGLMLVILLAQFNSFYNSILVLTAVIFSTFGVLLGLVVMGQPFSVIMSGTGVLALAGIIVNNNIILIDALNENLEKHELFEAITRTVETRLRPILLTTVTTMLGLFPMMLGISLDFLNGGYSIDAPTSLWWKPLATAIVFGLGFATVLTLIVTPTLLAARYWVSLLFRNIFAAIFKRPRSL